VDRDELLQFIESGAFEDVVGAVETADVDFKRSPYRAEDDPAEAFELAKDVTALANTTTGGLLVIGFQTTAREESGLDTVESVHAFPREMFNRDQWLKKVHQLAYPTVLGLDAQFKPSAQDSDRGVVVILVPPQPADSRYFLVSKEFVSADGAPGWMIGLSVRSADRNRPLSIQEIHALVSRSLNLGADVDELKALVKELHMGASGAPTSTTPANSIDDRVRRAISEMESI
jgi:predicted HTH transcriptional regulator